MTGRPEVPGMPARGKTAAIGLCLLMVLSSLPAVMSSEGGEGAIHAGRSAVAGDAWLPAGTYEQDIDIPKGGMFYAAIGPDGSVTPAEVPAPATGMTSQVLSAIDRAPEWLRENLTKKFSELATERIQAPALAPGDFDRDADPDLFASQGDRNLTFFRNLGNSNFPVFVRGSVLRLDLAEPVPCAGDINGDGQLELAVGEQGGRVYVVQFYKDPGDPMELHSWSMTYQSGNPSVSSRASPSLGDMDGDGDLDMVVGDALGKIQYFENVGNRTNWSFQKTANSILFAPLVVPGPARPALVDLDGDGYLDIAVGAGNGIIHYFKNIGTRSLPAWAPDDLLLFSGIKGISDASPAFIRLDGDNRTDLLLGQGPRPSLIYSNTGTTTNPAWSTWPFYDYTPSVGYYDPLTYLAELDFDGPVAGYARAILGASQNLVDEISFSIAHSAVEALRQSSPELYVENARSLYENDLYIDYAQIIDYADYSTVRYTVNQSGKLSSYELPRDIYYWYIVHPKITDEMPLYIDPDETSGSVNQSARPPDGKFWRNYIFFNADSAYPPDPATDANGDGVPDFHYPKTMSPPLLKDLLAGVKTMWNCTAYNSPAGFDNDGMNNSHPFDYGDHAIEKVSNWVMKTLPLNEQESADGERPIQPVRIARGHNGNCGELGDLTVAAARAALIPAVEVSMLGEDHVWIEFYERGWHQWDNYWSDSGSVIDNFMNYWVGWGHRGGSGISGWRGDDYEFPVTSDYIPPPSQSHVTINVKDSAGYPVDGARVVVMSHWMAESQQPKTGITYPFPAIWNYTDGKGSTTFVLAHNNFTIEVTSKLGRTAENKTYIGEGQDRVFNFTLQGRLPDPSPRIGPNMDGGQGRTLHAKVKMTGGEQRPPNPEVGTTSVQPITTGLGVDVLLMNQENFTTYLSGLTAQADVWLEGGDLNPMAYFSSNGTWYLVLSNERTIETAQTVHLIMNVSVLHRTPSLVIDYPVNGTVVDASRPIPATGRIIGEAPVGRMELSIDNGVRQNMTSGLDRPTGKWRWETDMRSLSSGPHVLTVSLFDDLGLPSSTSVVVLTDRYPPRVLIDSPPDGSLFDLDAVVDVRGRATDDMGVKAVQYRLDGGPVTGISGSMNAEGWNFTLPAEVLGGGTHLIEVKAIDIVGRSSNATVSFELRDSTPPALTITEPGNYDAIEVGDSFVISGTVHDTSGIANLVLTLGGKSVDILSGIDRSDGWSLTWDTSGRPDTGEISFSVAATDRVGNRAVAGRTIRLVDTLAPSVSLQLPTNGTVVRIGDRLNFSGIASDKVGVLRLEVKFDGQGWKSIIGSLRDGNFRHYIDIADLQSGKYNITVRAADGSGNTATAQVYINVLGLERPAKKTPAKAASFIPGMDLAVLLCALGALAVAGRVRRSGE